ncbi:MAG TPA: serine/threonine-protein kinase [Gemmatimonadales bacterium]
MNGTPLPVPATDFASRLAAALAPEYELRELLGRGGFGEVYAAWDPSLKREVAIKTLRPDLASQDDIVRRFRREAEAAAGLRHQSILPVYAVGERAGIVWFSMPRVHGESLRDWLRREPQPPIGEVRRILGEVAAALGAAHEAGVVHRDVKPDNILLEGDDRRVLVTDFGIAKAVDAGDTGLTLPGVAVGSPDYMSPEQAAGDPVDHRADIYSLGVLGFEMVAGHLPFGAGTVAVVLLRHATEAPPSLLDVRPACPSHLAAVMSRCLAKEPAARWPTMGALREALMPHAEMAAARSEGRAASRTDRGLGRRAAAYAVLWIGAVVADVAGWLDWSAAPVASGGLALAAALELGALRARGLGWRDALHGRRARHGPHASLPTPAATARFGGWAVVVGRVLADRMAVRGMVARLPASERKSIQDLLPILDRLVAEAIDAAEQLATLEREVADGRSLEDRVERRRELSGQMDRSARAVADLRRAVRAADAEGMARLRDDVNRLTGGVLVRAAPVGDQHGERQEQADRPDRRS